MCYCKTSNISNNLCQFINIFGCGRSSSVIINLKREIKYNIERVENKMLANHSKSQCTKQYQLRFKVVIQSIKHLFTTGKGHLTPETLTI